MIEQPLHEQISARFIDPDDPTDTPNLYFNLFYSYKDLTVESADLFTQQVLESKQITRKGEFGEKGVIIQISRNESDSPILFWESNDNEWLLCYSSDDFSTSSRRKISKAATQVGWVLNAQTDSSVVDEIYEEFSPVEEDVNVERTWDPYWLYERERDVPDELQSYYDENIKEFVEREIQFNVKTPKWLVDTALEEGVQKDLLEKSSTSKTRFTFDLEDNETSVVSDGGILASNSDVELESNVTVKQDGQIVHRGGNPEATFTLLDEVSSREKLREEFSKVVPNRAYNYTDDGRRVLESYDPGKVLKVVFTNKSFNEEASLKLSNLLTVGHGDVDIHGVVQSRSNLEFFTESYTVFDNGEYDILFTTDGQELAPRPALYIKPTSSTTSGLIYIYQKLKEKFDPRTQYDIVDELPDDVFKQEVAV